MKEQLTGLTREEVIAQREAGNVNIDDMPATRTYKAIILENTLTFFNLINVVLLALVLLVGSFQNSLFAMVILVNTVIGIVQEIRAKKILDRLAILTASKVFVLRDGKESHVPTEELVLGDVIRLKAGEQIPADAEVLEGVLEVNESLLTGESDNLTKQPGDALFSGSFVTAGTAWCKVVHVGKDNYAAMITSEAKTFRKHNSELRNSLNKILKVVSFIILPLGGALFCKQYLYAGDSFADSIVNTVAAVLGMIPEGLVLLTSLALTLGAMKLAKQRTLVQELFCIETLARVDTLCLDKTGTITEGHMCVEDVILLENAKEFSKNDVAKAMGNLMHVLHDDNATFKALHTYFPEREDFTEEQLIPFSSDRKYSGAAFAGEGTYLMGAVQFLFPKGKDELMEQCQVYAQEGHRILVLAHSEEICHETELPEDLQPVALFLLSDVIRPEAPETLAFFRKQGVDLKVISGDDPVTVAAVARRAGLANANRYVDATTLVTPEDMEQAVREYTVFGRVTPKQKREMVSILKQHGHTVAMTGDGVNDVLALKEADCSIAMAEGSEAAKNIANLVLLDSNFSAMPHILNQGRRVINNIRLAASMFLVKTIFSVLLSLLTIIFGSGYPFEPIQMSIIGACAVGIPTFLMAKEENFDQIGHGFLKFVFAMAFPPAMTITICVFLNMVVCDQFYGSNEMLSTACVLVTGWEYLEALSRVYPPRSLYRKMVVNGMKILFFGLLVIGQEVFDLLGLRSLEFGMIVQVFFLMTISPPLAEQIARLVEKGQYFWSTHRHKRLER